MQFGSNAGSRCYLRPTNHDITTSRHHDITTSRHHDITTSRHHESRITFFGIVFAAPPSPSANHEWRSFWRDWGETLALEQGVEIDKLLCLNRLQSIQLNLQERRKLVEDLDGLA